jgi:hypothetical protein
MHATRRLARVVRPLHTVLDTVAVFACQTVSRNIKRGGRAGVVCATKSPKIIACKVMENTPLY